jgi:FixJ family two-component response regulator
LSASQQPGVGGEADTIGTVLIVDDDASLVDALRRLFRTVDLGVQAYRSAAELLHAKHPDTPSCILLDIRLPGPSGLDLQTELANSGIQTPIVFMTGHGDISMTVRAMKSGAVDFLEKPFRDQDMLDAVIGAIEKDRRRRLNDEAYADLRRRYEALSPREKEIMTLVTKGLMNKQVAAEVDLSEITVKIHRGHVMKKMEAKTFAELVRMAEALGLNRENKP